MGKIYGYCRISRKTQKLERQIENISKVYPTSTIITEAFTGTKIDRPEFAKLLKKISAGDTIIFDSVSRMSRNAEEGTKLYFELFDKGIDLIFLKESYINTNVYKEAISQSIETTGNEIADIYIEATNKVIKMIATKQIEKAFEQAEKEVTDLHERTSEGLREAKKQGKRVGLPKGSQLITKKSIEAKKYIVENNKDFNGTLTNEQTWTCAKISKMTFYKYKAELQNEIKAAEHDY